MSRCVSSSQTIIEGSDRVSQKGAKPVSPVVTEPPTPGLQLAPTPSPSAPAPITVAQGPGATTHGPVNEAELDKKKTPTILKPEAKDGVNVREEYGYIVTNQRYAGTRLHFHSFWRSLCVSQPDLFLDKVGF